MKRVLTIKAVVGLTVASDVYTEKGQLVIKKGTVLNREIIEKLKMYGVFDFYVEEDKAMAYTVDELERNILDDDSDGGDDLNDSAYYRRIRKSKKFQRFENMFNESLVEVQSSINELVLKNNPINAQAMIDSIKEITNGFRPDVSVFDMLHCIEGYDDLTYVHSINVSLISRMIATWMKLSENDVDTVTLGGLLHDVGKVMIPNEIITKPARLTDVEYNIIKTHPIHGYNILKDQNIDERVKLCALQHHERCDGRGYPYQKTYDEIEPLARIVAIADVYDAMTSNRVYRRGMCPYDVIAVFEDNMDMYDPVVLSKVLEKIANTYINENVLLSDNTKGKIVMINPHKLSKPVVEVNSEYVDLSREKDKRIVALC